MAIILSIIAVGALALCISDWRSGMFICVVVGFLADTLRKITPDQPVYFVVVVGVFALAVAIGFVGQHGLVRFTDIRILRGSLRIPLTLLMLWLAIEAVMSYGYYGNIILVGIGLISYLAPIPGFLVAYYFGLRIPNAVQFVKFYALLSSLMVSGIFLSFLGFDSTLLDEVGTGVLIHVPGGILESYPGFLRSTEGAAWHAAAASSLIIVLAVSGFVRWPKVVTAVLVVLLISAGLMTGRRKMLMEILIFLSIYGALLLFFTRKAGKMMLIGATTAILLSIVGVSTMTDVSFQGGQRFTTYVERGATVFGEVDERFAKLGLGSVGWALARYGFLGGGVGIASQGGQHFGGGSSRFGSAGEGGLGKIVAELGVPGLVLIVWTVCSILLYLRRLVVEVARLNNPVVPFFLGLIAFLAANVPLFIVATQIFGDPFVLLILGWMFGFMAAASDVALRMGSVGACKPRLAATLAEINSEYLLSKSRNSW